MRGELLIRCARVLIRVENSQSEAKILHELRDVLSKKVSLLGLPERIEATYTLSMFEYREKNVNKAIEMLESVFEDARRLASPRLCRRVGRFLAYLMMRQHREKTNYVISYLLFWSMGSNARQRALAELRRRETVSESVTCSDRLSEIFAHDWKSCENLHDAALAFQNLVNELPKDWCILGICTPPRELTYFEEDARVMLTRIRNGELSVVRFGKGEIEDVRNVLFEFRDILSSSEKTTKGITPVSGKEWTKSERKKWWDERHEQDNRMKEMLTSMQEKVLGIENVAVLFGDDFDDDDDKDDDNFDDLCSRFQKLKVANLKSQLKERDLSRAGRKSDLVKRLASAVSSSSSSSSSSTSVICIFDEILQRLPWESIPHIRDNTLSVSRCPAAAFAFASRIRSHDDVISATFRSARTLVNPSGDLKRTQKVRKPLFERFQCDYNWKPIARPGEKPMEGSVRDALESSDCELFVYCGHNAGEEFLSSKHALRLRSTPNVMMLVGCSSGRLRDEGMFEPHGTILQYACAGVPCIVANLWDVTDGDIDRFLIRVLEELHRQGCGREGNDVQVSMLRAVSAARSACKLQFAVGAAPVCYGVPVVIH